MHPVLLPPPLPVHPWQDQLYCAWVVASAPECASSKMKAFKISFPKQQHRLTSAVTTSTPLSLLSSPLLPLFRTLSNTQMMIKAIALTVISATLANAFGSPPSGGECLDFYGVRWAVFSPFRAFFFLFFSIYNLMKGYLLRLHVLDLLRSNA